MTTYSQHKHSLNHEWVCHVMEGLERAQHCWNQPLLYDGYQHIHDEELVCVDEREPSMV